MTTAEPGRPAAPPTIRLGLWGAPQSGKTTFLASLGLAANRREAPGNWIMNGSDDEASEFLITNTELLTNRPGKFPEATFITRNLLFRFTGEEEVHRRLWTGRRISEIEQVAFELDVLDVPGKVYGPPSRKDPGPYPASTAGSVSFPEQEPEDGESGDVDPEVDVEEQLLEHLENCDGIIYLFDPIRDARNGDAFDYFHRILERLTRRTFEQERYQGTRLPQHLAVCITKFDEPQVYKMARRFGFTTQDAERPCMPRVPDGDAAEFFRRLCMDAPNGTADLVQGSLGHFYSDRVAYFVTSAIGFYVGSTKRFQPSDYVNIEKTGGSTAGIRGRVYPINVLEPLLWLQRSIRNTR